MRTTLCLFLSLSLSLTQMNSQNFSLLEEFFKKLFFINEGLWKYTLLNPNPMSNSKLIFSIISYVRFKDSNNFNIMFKWTYYESISYSLHSIYLTKSTPSLWSLEDDGSGYEICKEGVDWCIRLMKKAVWRNLFELFSVWFRIIIF